MTGRLGLAVVVAVAIIVGPDVAAADDGPRAMLVPRQHTVLSAQTAGRLAVLAVEAGDRFRKGQVLAALDCRLAEARKAVAVAGQRSAQEGLDGKRRLAQLRSGSALELTLAEVALDKASAEVAVAEAALALCRVVAPFSGRVAARLAEPFESVEAGTPLFEVFDDSRWQVKVIVPSRWLVHLKPGARFTVRMDETGRDYPAAVTRIGARIDPGSQSVEILGGLEAMGPELLWGMSGVTRWPAPAR